LEAPEEFMADSKKKNKKKEAKPEGKSSKKAAATPEAVAPAVKLTNKEYLHELDKLEAELVKLQFWVKETGARIVVVFEGRDAAGKGGTIKAITDRVSPRVFRVVALPAPNEREKTQIYFQRYIEQLPAAGEIVVFDRSWYNRAGVEHVMGFCTQAQYESFLQTTPMLEAMVIDSGIILIKYWLEVSNAEQTRRFEARMHDPRKLWKLSPMDLESHRLWHEYTLARDAMLAATDTEKSPWNVIGSNDKKRARLNCIHHLLKTIPYRQVPLPSFKLPKRKDAKKADRPNPNLRYIPSVF
jgi:polyphosphate kinase 2